MTVKSRGVRQTAYDCIQTTKTADKIIVVMALLKM